MKSTFVRIFTVKFRDDLLIPISAGGLLIVDMESSAVLCRGRRVELCPVKVNPDLEGQCPGVDGAPCSLTCCVPQQSTAESKHKTRVYPDLNLTSFTPTWQSCCLTRESPPHQEW